MFPYHKLTCAHPPLSYPSILFPFPSPFRHHTLSSVLSLRPRHSDFPLVLSSPYPVLCPLPISNIFLLSSHPVTTMPFLSPVPLSSTRLVSPFSFRHHTLSSFLSLSPTLALFSLSLSPPYPVLCPLSSPTHLHFLPFPFIIILSLSLSPPHSHLFSLSCYIHTLSPYPLSLSLSYTIRPPLIIASPPPIRPI